MVGSWQSCKNSSLLTTPSCDKSIVWNLGVENWLLRWPVKQRLRPLLVCYFRCKSFQEKFLPKKKTVLKKKRYIVDLKHHTKSVSSKDVFLFCETPLQWCPFLSEDSKWSSTTVVVVGFLRGSPFTGTAWVQAVLGFTAPEKHFRQWQSLPFPLPSSSLKLSVAWFKAHFVQAFHIFLARLRFLSPKVLKRSVKAQLTKSFAFQRLG